MHAFLKRQTELGLYTNAFVATREKTVYVFVRGNCLGGIVAVGIVWVCIVHTGSCLGAYCPHGELSGCVLSTWGVV